MTKLRLHLLILFCVFKISFFAQTQPGTRGNLQPYYEYKVNFGFYLGFNRTNFLVTTVHDYQAVAGDSLKSILSSPQTGFNLGIVSELRLQEYMTLRFLPDIAFGERDLEYHFASSRDTFDIVKKVESTFIDFPLDLKVRSKRLGDFAAYMVGGGKYTLDLASQKDVNNGTVTSAQQVVKLGKSDFAYEVGAGTDFFLPYFKFGIELKLSMGLKNLLIKDNTIYAQSLDRLNSKVFLVSLTFEG